MVSVWTLHRSRQAVPSQPSEIQSIGTLFPVCNQWARSTPHQADALMSAVKLRAVGPASAHDNGCSRCIGLSQRAARVRRRSENPAGCRRAAIRCPIQTEQPANACEVGGVPADVDKSRAARTERAWDASTRSRLIESFQNMCKQIGARYTSEIRRAFLQVERRDSDRQQLS